MAEHQPGINALFVLECGCILDGCHDSGPGRSYAEDGPNTGKLMCTINDDHGWQLIVDVVSLEPLEALPDPEETWVWEPGKPIPPAKIRPDANT